MNRSKILALVFVLSSSAFAASASDMKNTTDPEERVEQLEGRVMEIWHMDRSELEKPEKLALKKELREIKRELKTAGLDDKVSISIGLIIIILLLILLL